MIFELIYTSYPRGLRSGTSGFTPVAYTLGMPKAYIQLCESLSGYTFIYPLGHPLYEQNPEIHSHYRFKINNDEISILSRVAVAGKDYTGRENKIAHHIIFDKEERLKFPLGPALLMLYGNIFVEQWDKNPYLLQPVNMEQPDIEQSVYPSNYFDIAFTLAKSAEQNLKTPSFILFDPYNINGHNYEKMCLKFLAEAFSVVAPEIRWNITFNTYFISKPMDSNCIWRCCPTKSVDQQGIVEKYPNSLIIDLTGKTAHGKVSIIKRVDNSDAKNLTEINSLKNSANGLLSTEESLIQKETLSKNLFEQIEKQEGEQLDYKDKNGEQSKIIAKKNTLIFISLFFSIAVIITFGFLSIYFIKTYNTKPAKNFKQAFITNINISNKIDKYNQIQTDERKMKNKIDKTQKTTYKKRVVLNFYEDNKNEDSKTIRIKPSDFSNIKCSLIRKDGTEIISDIESPIVGDTPNWDIFPKDTKEPAGSISMDKIYIYDKNLYSGIYIDVTSNEYADFIWVSPITITPSMISKGEQDVNTLEIRFDVAISELLYKFLSLLPQNSLIGLVELKQNGENLKELNGSLDETNDNAKKVKDSQNKIDDGAKVSEDIINNTNSNTKQDEDIIEKISDKLIFSPIVSLKNTTNKKDEKQNEKGENKAFDYIQLKFKDGDLKVIFRNSVSKKEFEKIEQNTIFKKIKIKQLRIDYKDKNNDKIYPILCMNC